MRIRKRVSLGGRHTLDGVLEVFNAFNHANYGNYVTNESNIRYGQTVYSGNVAYQPRMLQLGFRVSF